MGSNRWGIAVLALVVSACGAATASSPSETRTCVRVPMLRLDGVEYENEQAEDRVAESDLGEVIGTITTLPAGLGTCEGITLRDGEGTVAPGTDIYTIDGVDPDVAVAAFYGTTFLRFNAR